MSDEDNAPTVRLGVGQVVQVEVSGTEDDSTEEVRDLALETEETLRERYHNLNEKEQERLQNGKNRVTDGFS